jgi:hypothetical protein
MRNAIARANNGPAPDPNALRRDRPSDKAEWTHLPAAGRQGDPPAWPISRANAAETAMWARLWALPQAIAWEHNRQELEVARHVRAALMADHRDAPTNLRALVLRQMESLGLTALGMRALRLTIDPTPEAPAPKSEPGDVVDIRSRMRDAGGAS